MLKKYQINKKFTHVSSVYLKKDAQTIFPFSRGQNTAAIEYALQAFFGVTTVTPVGTGINIALSKLFSADGGARRNIPKTILLFVTKDTDVAAFKTKIKTLKMSGINLVIVAVGGDVDMTILSPLVDTKDKLFVLDDRGESNVPELVVIETLPGMLF